VRIENTFEVPASPESAWALLTDVPRVLPCMPGAELEEAVDERTWRVLLHVKLGPISLQFRSNVEQSELDADARHAVLSVDAREVRGRGAAQATIASSLAEAGSGTRVSLVTELSLRGAVAQYGRGVVGSVARELTEQFARCLASLLENDDPPPPAELRPVGGLRLLFGGLWRRVSRRKTP
jgi:carbon monoxide dehydrogenase subunit G